MTAMMNSFGSVRMNRHAVAVAVGGGEDDEENDERDEDDEDLVEVLQDRVVATRLPATEAATDEDREELIHFEAAATEATKRSTSFKWMPKQA